MTAVPTGLRERAAVGEVGVEEVRVEVEVVVDRVVDAVVVLAAVAEVERRDADVLEETACSRIPIRARRCAGRPGSRASLRSSGVLLASIACACCRFQHARRPSRDR